MDVVERLSKTKGAISTVEMHTVGEPTRIIYSGYPSFQGTLFQQRAEASNPKNDHLRRKLMHEPRGHREMYGAILRPTTEHTSAGRAHMGVLFTTNSGFSTMCGHATIALSRFLIDTHDLSIFPQRNLIPHDPATRTSELLLHAPCGIVTVTVPTTAGGTRSDPSRPVSHVSVPSFATGIDVRVEIPESLRWPELKGSTFVIADFSYGGAFYCLVPATTLGFENGLRKPVDLKAMDLATKNLKEAVNLDPELRYLFSHPEHDELGFLYSIIVVDREDGGEAAKDSQRAETGVCFFADQQVDRSPTGSGVAARIALGFAKGRERVKGKRVTFHSLLSRGIGGEAGFVGGVQEVVGENEGFPVVRVKVEGYASYVGTSTFVVEDGDPLGDDGFLFDRLS